MKQTLLALLLTIFFFSPEIVRAVDFSASLGGIAINRPTFEGAHDYEFDLLPLVNISIGKSVFVNVE